RIVAALPLTTDGSLVTITLAGTFSADIVTAPAHNVRPIDCGVVELVPWKTTRLSGLTVRETPARNTVTTMSVVAVVPSFAHPRTVTVYAPGATAGATARV